MLRAIKIRLYLNKDQEGYVSNLLGTSRFIYNNLLAYKISEYNTNNHSVSFGELGKKLVELKSEYDWIKLSHSKVLQQSIINLEYAYKSFFKNGSGFPKFKSKKSYKESCRFPSDAIGDVCGNRINIIKQLRDIHFKCSRRDEIILNKNKQSIKSATLTKTKTGKYFLSILIDTELTKTLNTPINSIIGIDMGIKSFIVDSKGNEYENIKIKRNNEKRISKLHRELSRKQGDSKNREKARIKLSKLYEKLNNKKENYLHEISNKLLNENQVIVIEDLGISNMLRNHNLAKSLQELSLYRFKSIIEYKAKWYSRDIIQVDRYFPSSKLCNKCGYKNTELKLSDREWICTSCNTTHNRDHNAAINIENEGNRIIRIGSSSPELTLMESNPIGSRGNKKETLFHDNS